MIKRATSSNIQANLKYQVTGWKEKTSHDQESQGGFQSRWTSLRCCRCPIGGPWVLRIVSCFYLLSNIQKSQQARECWTFHGSSLQGTWSHWGTSQGPAPSWVGSINHKQEKYFITSHHRYRYFLVQTSPEKNIFLFNPWQKKIFATSAIPRTNICLNATFHLPVASLSGSCQ